MKYIKKDIEFILEDIKNLKAKCKIKENDAKFDKLSEKIKKLETSFTSRKIIKGNYDKVSKALSFIFHEDKVSSTTKKLLGEARDQAILELPNELENFVDVLFKKALDFSEYSKNILTGKNPNGHYSKKLDKLREELDLKHAIEKYKKYLKM